MWENFDAKPKCESVISKRSESLRILEENISKYHVKTKQVQEDRKKMAQKAQWEVDQKIRETIEGLEQKGKEKAKAEISNFLSESPIEAVEDVSSRTKAVKTNIPKPEPKEELANKPEKYAKNIVAQESAPARKCVQIGVNFTPWDYVTPKRENKVPPNFAKHSLVHQEGDRNFEETQPLFLRDKGNTFFKKRDFESAGAAFSESLAILPQPCVYISRAICHFKSGHCNLALSDVKISLQQLDQLETTDASILGIISCFQGALHFQLREYEHALECWKSKWSENCELSIEWEILESMVGELTSFRSEHTSEAKNYVDGTQELLLLKQKGDSEFQSGNFETAIELYSRALLAGSAESKEGLRVLLNRSAAYLASEGWTKCVEDCDLLLQSPSLLSTEQRTKAYIRRGTSYFRLSTKYIDPSGILEKAHMDFCMANGLGGSRSVAADAKKVEKLWAEIPKPEYHFKMGEFRLAAEDFLTLSQNERLKSEYLANASTCYLRLLQLKRCEMLAKKSLDTNPATKIAERCKINLAICSCYRGKLEEGKSAIEKIIEQGEDSSLHQTLQAEMKKVVECLANGTRVETTV